MTTAKAKTTTEPPNIVPLCSYSNPLRRTSDRQYDSPNETVSMNVLYGAFRFTDPRMKQQRLAYTQLMYNYWHNFCGGMFFFSPQVYISYPYATNTDEYLPSLDTMFEGDGTQFNERSVEALLWDSLAAGMLSLAVASNKRWLVGADREGGRLQQLVKHMKKLSGHPIYGDNIHVVGGLVGKLVPKDPVLRKRHEDQWSFHVTPPTSMNNVTLEVFDGAEARNWNSGSTCTSYNVVLSHSRDPDNSPRYQGRALSEQNSRHLDYVTSCVKKVEYIELLPNQPWGN